MLRDCEVKFLPFDQCRDRDIVPKKGYPKTMVEFVVSDLAFICIIADFWVRCPVCHTNAVNLPVDAQATKLVSALFSFMSAADPVAQRMPQDVMMSGGHYNHDSNLYICCVVWIIITIAIISKSLTHSYFLSFASPTSCKHD